MMKSIKRNAALNALLQKIAIEAYEEATMTHNKMDDDDLALAYHCVLCGWFEHEKFIQKRKEKPNEKGSDS